MTTNGNGHCNGDVLVVEDDPEVNDLVGAYVELAGFDHRSALTGKQALSEARTQPPALIVLDVMLPDLSGFEVCRALKSDQRTSQVPVIMLTALGGEKDRQQGMACGAATYLTKPFDPDRLIQAVRTTAMVDS